VTLGVVSRQESIRSGRIAQTLGVDPSVVSRQLASLERLGLVARCVDPADRRAELVSATSIGREQLQEARAAMCDELADRLGAWDPDSIHHAASVVEDLAGLFNADTITTEDSKDAHA
jgi:DNA-binding MarR family transcriptional regulator